MNGMEGLNASGPGVLETLTGTEDVAPGGNEDKRNDNNSNNWGPIDNCEIMNGEREDRWKVSNWRERERDIYIHI